MVRLILYNIQYLEGNTGKKREYLKFWRRVVHPKGFETRMCNSLKKYKPDILALVEIDGSSFVEREDYLAYFKKRLGMKYQVRKVKYLSKFLRRLPLLKNQANAILSKKEITHYRSIYLNEGVKKVVIDATVKVPQKVVLLLAHLSLGYEVRKKQLTELTKLVSQIKGPVILIGDFNTFRGEKEIKKLLKETGMKHRFKLKSHGRIFTYPSFHPRRRFDYILTSKEIKVKKYDILKFNLSDHLPVLVDFEVGR